MNFLNLSLVFTFLVFFVGFSKQEDNPDMHRNTSELIRARGFNVETHVITTNTGYGLVAFRIPSNSSGIPVMITHGILQSSDDFLMQPDDKALPYQLARLGYDVWLCNTRGNNYSNLHVIYDSSNMNSRYWDFSIDQMADEDIPKTIDYILTKTGHEKLFYVGFSLGTTLIFAALDLHPEYNYKIIELFALAPVANNTHATCIIYKLSYLSDYYGEFATLFGYGELIPHRLSNALLPLLGEVCKFDEEIQNPLCMNIIYLIFGPDSKQTNDTWTPVIFSHTPSGISTRTIIQTLQIFKDKRFQKYDYGIPKENKKHYNSSTLSIYDLTAIRVPTTLFWSEGDVFANELDVGYMLSRIKINSPTSESFKIIYDDFAHIDHTYGINASEYVYAHLIRKMNATYYLTQEE